MSETKQLEEINLDQFATETLANRDLYKYLAVNVPSLTDEALARYTWTNEGNQAVRIVKNEINRREKSSGIVSEKCGDCDRNKR
jgi:hypothetical protein